MHVRNRSDDRCTTRTAGRTKTAAGITVFLLEELSDARMRCAQLKKLVADATDLVEKSSHRDHFFEVAAHLIHGIPDTLFRLDKALDAAAMSASRMDYEEIKQNLRPEKAEEMDQVLQDARLRYLTRRSQQLQSPSAATAEIERIASVAEQTGNVPVADLLVLAAALELGVKTASESTEKTAADRLRDIARGASNEKSRVALAKALRTFLADALQPTAGQAIQAVMQSANSREEVMDGFKQSNPDLTEEQLKEIADQWEANKNVVKDKAAGEATSAEMLARFHEGKPADPTENMSEEDAAKWKAMNDEHGDNFKTASKLTCDGEKDCKESVTHIDNKGFVYCKKHGERRKSGGVPCRALKPAEIKKLEADQTIRYAAEKVAFVPDALSAERVGLFVDSMRDRLLIAQRSLKSGDWRHFKVSLRHFVADLGSVLAFVGLQSGADKLSLVNRELIALPLGSGAEVAPAPRMAKDKAASGDPLNGAWSAFAKPTNG